ncbi:MAG: siphovirus Gp157 family protein [Acidobacteriota bacterium]
MNITLHKATEQVRELLDQIDPETGELPEGFEDARAVVINKSVSVAAYILETELSIESAKGYVKQLQATIKTEEKRQEWLRRYLQEHMAAAGITEIKDERGVFKASLSVGRDESVEVFDEAQLPIDYMREIPAKTEPDKTLIKKAIKDGFEVPGARLVKKDRLTIK